MTSDEKIDGVAKDTAEILRWTAGHTNEHFNLNKTVSEHHAALFGDRGIKERVALIEKTCLDRKEAALRLEVQAKEAAVDVPRIARNAAAEVAREALAAKQPLWRQILIPAASSALAALLVAFVFWLLYINQIHTALAVKPVP